MSEQTKENGRGSDNLNSPVSEIVKTMDDRLYEMLDAGIDVKFCAGGMVQCFPKGSNAWWYGVGSSHYDALVSAYEKWIR